MDNFKTEDLAIKQVVVSKLAVSHQCCFQIITLVHFQMIFLGTPSPTLTWIKETSHGNEDLRDHVTMTDNTAVLKLTSSNRYHAGSYICSASNGYQPVTKKIRVHVEYPPEIHVNTNTIMTHVGAQEELACTVHAYPHAKVTWMKVSD